MDPVPQLSRIIERAEDLFEGDRDAALVWLKTNDALFEGKTPLEYAETEPGAKFVLQVIMRLEHGVFS